MQICTVMRGPAKKCGGGPAPRPSEALHDARSVQEALLCAHRLQLASESFCRTIYLQIYQCSHFCLLSLSFSKNAKFTMAGTNCKPKTRPSKMEVPLYRLALQVHLKFSQKKYNPRKPTTTLVLDIYIQSSSICC